MWRCVVAGVPGALPAVFAMAALIVLASGCSNGSREGGEGETMSIDDIKIVMEAHVDELMAISGVVGVAIGALDDGTPCIRVLLLEDSPELRSRIPQKLDGHPVEIDVTGEIRAMPDEEK